MSVIVINSTSQFEEVLKANPTKLIVMDFTATWCGPCKMIKPHFAELAAKHTEAIFLSIDVDVNGGLAARYKVSAMPTFQFYKGNVCVGSFRGASIQKLNSYVENLKIEGADLMPIESGGGGGCQIL